MIELRPIRVVHYGLGAIGSSIAQLTSTQRGLQVVGGIDCDPAKVGRDLGELIGLDHPLGAVIADDANMVLEHTRPDVVIVATTSLFNKVYPQVLTCIRARANVISTCEELVYPYAKSPEPSAKINSLARLSGVTVLGAGANPGFVMDLLPLLLTAPCVDIRRIAVTRVVDATNRRASLQQRIGAGLTLDEFHEHVARGAVRHVGLIESVYMIAAGLGWQLHHVTETIEPVIADGWVDTPSMTIAPGQIAGVRQVAQGWLHGRDAITLTWQTAVGIPDTHDAIRVDGTPPVDLVIRNGLHGDQAAAALILHAIPRVLAAPPGLTTVLELPPLHYQPRPEPDVTWSPRVLAGISAPD
jgi:4-hydroxy-tetrahydrodipicolinate reductase